MSNRRMVVVEVTDWDNAGWSALAGVLERVGSAVGMVEYRRRVIAVGRRSGESVPLALVSFDASKVRDSWVHGWVVDAGYVAAIRS